MRGQTDPSVSAPANAVVFVKIHRDLGPGLIGRFKEATGLPRLRTGFGSQFRVTGGLEGLESQTSHGLLHTFAAPGGAGGYDGASPQQTDVPDHPAQSFVVSPGGQWFVGRLRKTLVAKIEKEEIGASHPRCRDGFASANGPELLVQLTARRAVFAFAAGRVPDDRASRELLPNVGQR